MMDALIPNESAMMPVKIAPMAYPKSRHKRKIPKLFALSIGLVFSATVAKNVGYTMAVPQPKIAANSK